MVSETFNTQNVNLQNVMSEMILVGKKVVERGLAVGSGGNLSFRVPGTDIFLLPAPEHNWIN